MNILRKMLGAAAFVSLAAFSLGTEMALAQGATQTPQRTAPKTKPAAAHAMSFTAEVTYESPGRMGFPLAYTTKSDVVMQRPDKLRVITLGDGPASEFYYDGKMMMAYAPAEDLVAVTDAPATQTMEVAYHDAGIYFPFDDVIVPDPYKGISDDLRMAFYTGQSNVVGGTTTDIVAHDTGGVFVEMWIGAGDKLPSMLRAIFADDPMKLRHRLELYNWHIDRNVTADFFTSEKANKAKHIKFARPDSPVPPRAGTNTTPASKPKSTNAAKPDAPNNSQ